MRNIRPHGPFAATSTDAKGQFALHPARAGEYYVEVQKEGYFAESWDGPTVDPVDSTGDAVSIDQEHPLRERKFALMRLGELRGRVIDEDGKPLAKLRVGLRTGTATQVTTDQDGYFVATKLRPGDYQVRILPARGLEILPQFSEGDLNIVDQDWETSSWPGTPLPVSSGASLSVGTIIARKRLFYRARLSVVSGDCTEGEKWAFSATPDMAGFGYPVPCAKEFLMRGLAPGSYSFAFSRGRFGEAKEWAVAPVEVTDHNLEVAMAMSPGAEISGRIVGAEGVTLPPLAKTTFMISRVPAGLSLQTRAADSAGKFRILDLPGGRSRISVNGLGAKFYVKEIRYNGLVVVDGIITPIAGTPTVLEIVIDDQAATISGSVAERDKATGRIKVVAVKWPVPPEAISLPMLLGENASAPADDQGRFQIGGLAPGEYRLLALTEDAIRLNADSLIRLLGRAEKVTLERGSSQSVSLKIAQP